MSFQPRQQDQTDTAMVDRVDQRTVNKRDGSNATLYEVFVVGASDPLVTFKRTLAESAFELVGQPAQITYSVKQNGDFTNYYLNSILPAPSSGAVAAQRAQEAQPLLRAAAGLPQPSAGLPEAPTGISEKDRSIHRQTAAKVAAALFAAQPSDAPTFWENVQRLTEYFDTGSIPGVTPSQQGPGSTYDDDIPFSPTL